MQRIPDWCTEISTVIMGFGVGVRNIVVGGGGGVLG